MTNSLYNLHKNIDHSLQLFIVHILVNQMSSFRLQNTHTSSIVFLHSAGNHISIPKEIRIIMFCSFSFVLFSRHRTFHLMMQMMKTGGACWWRKGRGQGGGASGKNEICTFRFRFHRFFFIRSKVRSTAIYQWSAFLSYLQWQQVRSMEIHNRAHFLNVLKIAYFWLICKLAPLRNW